MFSKCKVNEKFLFPRNERYFFLSFIKIGSQPTSASMFCKLKMMFEIPEYLIPEKNSISRTTPKHNYFLKQRKNPKEDDEQDGTYPSECRHQAIRRAFSRHDFVAFNHCPTTIKWINRQNIDEEQHDAIDG